MNTVTRIYSFNADESLGFSFVVKPHEAAAADALVAICQGYYREIVAPLITVSQEENDDDVPVWIDLHHDLNGKLSYDDKPVYCGCRLNFKQGKFEGEIMVPSSLALKLQAALEDGDLKMERFMYERIPVPHWVKFDCDVYPEFAEHDDFAYCGSYSRTVRHGDLRHVYLDMAILKHISGMLYETPDGRYLKVFKGNSETPSSIRFVKKG